MTRIYAHVDGQTSQVDRVDPAWLAPGGRVRVWVDLLNPSPEEGRQTLAGLVHVLVYFRKRGWI